MRRKREEAEEEAEWVKRCKRLFETFPLKPLTSGRFYFISMLFFEISVSVEYISVAVFRGEFRRDMVEMLPHRRLQLAKNTFLGEKSWQNAAPASHQLPVEVERRREGEKRRRRGEERSGSLCSPLYFKGGKHRGLMTSLLFLSRTVWDVHDSVRVSA